MLPVTLSLKETLVMTPIKRSGLAALGLAALLALPASAQQTLSPDSLPDELFAPVGTVLTVQIRDHISSNRNAPGDRFLGTLQQPLVIDGWVVARPGQTVIGQVTSANSAGRVKGTSDLAVELTEIVLVDGHHVPVQTQLMRNYGRTSHGEDAGAIAGGTALGALIGAAAGNGKGAAIGAGIGAAASVVGVLSTRGRATEIYPESTMTFRLDAPLIVPTAKSRQAFLAVSPRDYERAPSTRVASRDRRPIHGGYPPSPYPPVYDPYPSRYPRYPGSRIGIIPSIVLVSPIIIDHRDRNRRHR
jgi:hypothetical protein